MGSKSLRSQFLTIVYSTGILVLLDGKWYCSIKKILEVLFREGWSVPTLKVLLRKEKKGAIGKIYYYTYTRKTHSYNMQEDGT